MYYKHTIAFTTSKSGRKIDFFHLNSMDKCKVYFDGIETNQRANCLSFDSGVKIVITSQSEFIYWHPGRSTQERYLNILKSGSFNESDYIKSIDAPLPKLHENAFYELFRECTSLEKIPSNIFSNNTHVTSFERCFMACRGLKTVPKEIFNQCRQVKNFDHCFDGCSSITSEVPPLWNTHKFSVHDGCFYSCKKSLNYNSIPDDWRNRDKNPYLKDLSDSFFSLLKG